MFDYLVGVRGYSLLKSKAPLSSFLSFYSSSSKIAG